jgi:Mannosyl-glycoprotein endo-beta-N-acetylglucosaminidase
MSLSAQAAGLPQVEISAKNKIPACATPGRLMAFLESRNGEIDPRFRSIAADYMRIGNELKIRWDVAFFQMMLETGNLTFKGDVQPTQNNFAGMGATGNHVPGESFPNVATGVKAHLQHLLMYAGEHIDNPVAERTRKVQEWGILTDWQKSLSGPVTYDQLAKQWAPTSRRYSREIGSLVEAFYGSPCKGTDPQPELMALAQPGARASKVVASAEEEAPPVDSKPMQTASADNTAGDTSPYISGAALAKRAAAEGTFTRAGLGAESLIPPSDAAPAVGEPPAADKAPTAFKVINASTASDNDDASTAAADNRGPADSAPVEPMMKKTSSKKSVQGAPPASSTKSIATKIAMVIPATGVKPKCKVWTASYGGGHSVIIRARADAQDNYTVLDVNEGSEKREAAAYIAAYAKGGETVGEYGNPSQALDKAFELCPDG